MGGHCPCEAMARVWMSNSITGEARLGNSNSSHHQGTEGLTHHRQLRLTLHPLWSRYHAKCLRCITCVAAIPQPVSFTNGELRPWELKSHQATLPWVQTLSHCGPGTSPSMDSLTSTLTSVPRGTCGYSCFVDGLSEAREGSPIAEITHPSRKPESLSTDL